jgi:hypothetical protein
MNHKNVSKNALANVWQKIACCRGRNRAAWENKMVDVAKELFIGGWVIFGPVQQAHKHRQKLVKALSSEHVSFQLLVELAQIINDCQMEKNRVISDAVGLSKGEGEFVELDCLLKKYGVATTFDSCQVMSKGEVEDNGNSNHLL